MHWQAVVVFVCFPSLAVLAASMQARSASPLSFSPLLKYNCAIFIPFLSWWASTSCCFIATFALKTATNSFVIVVIPSASTPRDYGHRALITVECDWERGIQPVLSSPLLFVDRQSQNIYHLSMCRWPGGWASEKDKSGKPANNHHTCSVKQERERFSLGWGNLASETLGEQKNDGEGFSR